MTNSRKQFATSEAVSHQTQLTAEILETAATWYVDLQDADAQSPLHESYQHWLQQSSLHKKAWLRVEKLQQTFANVPNAVSHTTLKSAWMSRRESIKSLCALLAVGASGTVAWQHKDKAQGLMASHRTRTGENKKLTLTDGTLLQLNTNTALDVNYVDNLREITLYHGEIQIITGKDTQQRDFIVTTPEGYIRALGTRFLVRSDNEHSVVSVLESAVEIEPAALIAKNLAKHSPKKITLTAGQQLSFSHTEFGSVQPITNNSNAWTNGLLVVSDWRLEDFIEELSRYYVGYLRCDDNVKNLRISGAFHLNNMQTVLDNLTSTLPLKIHYLTRYWVTISIK